jgi:hypothetical protein
MGTIVRQPAPIADSHAVVVEELTPKLDAVGVWLRVAHLPHVLFLDSAGPYRELGRYSFVTADPFEWLWSRGRAVYSGARVLSCADPFAAVQERLEKRRLDPRADLRRFRAGQRDCSVTISVIIWSGCRGQGTTILLFRIWPSPSMTG